AAGTSLGCVFCLRGIPVPRPAVAALSALVTAAASAQQAPLTLEKIMADPDWIAAQIEVPEWYDDHGVAPSFGADGQSVYYRAKRSGSPIRDLHRIELAGGKDSVVDATAMASADGGQLTFDPAHARAAFVRNGDIFIREVASRRL